MSRDRSAAMFARIGSYGKLAAGLLKRLREVSGAPVGDRRETHDMRGPGPKWRAKQSANRDPKR